MDLVLKSLSMSAFGKEIDMKAEKIKKNAVSIHTTYYLAMYQRSYSNNQIW